MSIEDFLEGNSQIGFMAECLRLIQSGYDISWDKDEGGTGLVLSIGSVVVASMDAKTAYDMSGSALGSWLRSEAQAYEQRS